MSQAIGSNPKFSKAGQEVLESAHFMNSAFIKMRSKPPEATFSSKALSFYSNEHKGGISSDVIVVPSKEHPNY